MRKDKEHIYKLRQEGKSYRTIQKETGVSRGTLCDWFKDEEWSRHLVREKSAHQIEISKERMIRMNMVRKLKLQYQYALMESQAVKEYETYRNETLFWAGLMVYAGEGDKRNKGLIRISNSEVYPHRIFLGFVRTYLSVTQESIRCALLIYPDLDEKECKEMWSVALAIPESQFHKTQILKGKESVKRLQFGVGMTIIMSTSLKKKLLKWLELAQGETFENAGMVQG